MSKSLGNGIDPLEVIDKYGADALRYTLITGNAPGNDMRFYWERVEASRNFANKVWNASRFIMMNDPDNKIKATDEKPANLTAADKWILSKMNSLIKEVTDNMEKYDLGIAVAKLNDFIWEEFCDWYIEMVKPRLYNDEDTTKTAAIWTLKKVLIDALKLLHPYMPFITEEIFCNIQDEEESIMISSWPVYTEDNNYSQDENAIETIKTAVRNIRNLRAEMNVAPSRKALVYIVSENENVRNIFANGKVFFATLGYASEVIIQDDKSGIGDDAVSVVIPKATIYMPFAELVDISKEIERLNKEVEKLNKELARVNGMLSNPNFVSKAPEKKINEEKAKQAKYQQMMDQVKSGNVSCIVVKDLSRFGRNYLEVGDYLEHLFPFLGVRFLSINDHYDSNDYMGSTGGLDVAFRNLIYQRYSQDLSEKVKSAKHMRMAQGLSLIHI